VNRPSVDDLKKLRDGQLAAGRPPPTCWICEEPVDPRGGDVVVSLVNRATPGKTEHVRSISYHHQRCEDQLGEMADDLPGLEEDQS
jgi:hypothetical protein